MFVGLSGYGSRVASLFMGPLTLKILCVQRSLFIWKTAHSDETRPKVAPVRWWRESRGRTAAWLTAGEAAEATGGHTPAIESQRRTRAVACELTQSPATPCPRLSGTSRTRSSPDSRRRFPLTPPASLRKQFTCWTPRRYPDLTAWPGSHPILLKPGQKWPL